MLCPPPGMTLVTAEGAERPQDLPKIGSNNFREITSQPMQTHEPYVRTTSPMGVIATQIVINWS